MRVMTVATLTIFVASQALFAQSAGGSGAKPGARDTAFAKMQERGKQAMGVDQYTSTHRFESLPSGGRIVLVRDVDDSAGVVQIRAHIRAIARAFQSGDFSTPEFVHMQMVPGTKVMREKREAITYDARDLPRGAELIIRTSDPEALSAISEFLAFQRQEHHAGGMGDSTRPPGWRDIEILFRQQGRQLPE